ncbi:MAG: hypothetical protein MUF15_22070 [Acidobacteria bacterium]|nr:hypothetical protein [Acidobacteriota bacterium]
MPWWLFIREKGARKENALKEITAFKKMEPVSPPLAEDLKEFIDHMEKIPLLRYKMLEQFHQFKEEHPLMVEKAMKEENLNSPPDIKELS